MSQVYEQTLGNKSTADAMTRNVPQSGDDDDQHEMEVDEERKAPPSKKQVVKSIIQTRRNAKLRTTRYNDLDDDEFDIDDPQALSEYNEALSKETFLGVKQIIERAEIKIDQPIVFIIKNIKNFNTNVLNDLIHMLKKYRN